MKKIIYLTFLILSLMFCMITSGWAGGLDDAKAGIAEAQKGNYDVAIRLYTKAIESGELSQQDLSTIYYNRGNAWYYKGDYDKAIADYDKVVEIDPRPAAAYTNRGNAWRKKGDYDKAIVDYTKAIESAGLSPQDLSNTYDNRGMVWMKKGDYDKAIADYTKAIEINPKGSLAYYHRGIVWKKKGDYDKAIADYDRVVEIDPKDAWAYNRLAWLMATCPDDRYRDGKRAVGLAEKAVQLKETASRLDTLAAAYAEAGRFQDAIQTQERSIKLAEKEGKTKHLAEFKEHLESYKAGKPCREE
jgi:tetratricopeptide (TPR) repeat protein